MQEAWLDIHQGGQTKRYALSAGRTRIGGAGCDVVLDGTPDPALDSSELHIWMSPPRVVYVGRGAPPLLDGRAFEQAPLERGSSLQWRGAILIFGQGATVLEELEEDLGQGGAGAYEGGVQDEVAGRVRAGLLADLNLTDNQAVKRWRAAVLASEFDPAACARELLAGEQVPPGDTRLLERASRLQRDLLMSAHQRGAKGVQRRARAATRSGAAYLLANLIAISIYTLVVLAVMLLVRVQYGTSFDGSLDRVIGIFGE
ncbi:MAG TPA: hypothetical protein EYQ74_07510 [Planctomycetes bacterium]|nr:hypothetical protein [Planctomycetota bacterium]HIK60210.1 hypothetical protein [Planctomycetota bacterium]